MPVFSMCPNGSPLNPLPSPIIPTPSSNQATAPEGEEGVEILEEKPKQQPGSLFAQKVVGDIVIAVIVVLFIGFATMFAAFATLLWQAWTEKAATYQSLVDKVNAQNEKIDLLNQQLTNEKIQPTITKPLPLKP